MTAHMFSLQNLLDSLELCIAYSTVNSELVYTIKIEKIKYYMVKNHIGCLWAILILTKKCNVQPKKQKNMKKTKFHSSAIAIPGKLAQMS